MQYLPKRKEIYLSALRKFISSSIQRHGLDGKSLGMLCRVRRAELKLHKEYLQSVDFRNLTDSVMYAAFLISLKHGRLLVYTLKSNAKIMIDSKLYTAFLSELCSSGKSRVNVIDITLANGEIIIIAEGIDDISRISFYMKKLNGIYYYSNDLKKLLIRIPAVSTLTAPERVYSAWEFTDPFSDVSIFLCDK